MELGFRFVVETLWGVWCRVSVIVGVLICNPEAQNSPKALHGMVFAPKSHRI